MKNYCLHHSFYVKDKNRLKTKCFCDGRKCQHLLQLYSHEELVDRFGIVSFASGIIGKM